MSYSPVKKSWIQVIFHGRDYAMEGNKGFNVDAPGLCEELMPEVSRLIYGSSGIYKYNFRFLPLFIIFDLNMIADQ